MSEIHKPQDQAMLALFCATMNALFLTTMNMFGKLLGDDFPPEQITFFRSIVAVLLLIVGLTFLRKLFLLKTQRPVAHLLRGSIGTFGLFMGIWAYTILPMSYATALIFTQPLWVVLLSYPVLREPVGPYRLAAVLVGFAGVWVIADPFSAQTALPLDGLVIGLIAGLFNALVALCLRWIGKTEQAATTVFYFLLFGTLSTALTLPFTGSALPVETAAMNISLLFILGLGGFGLASLLVKTYSYRLGEASLVTPVSYTMIVWAGLFDYFIWDKLPTWNLITGSLIIVASNLFILWREHVKKKKNLIEASNVTQP